MDELQHVGPYFSKRFSSIAGVKTPVQLLRKFKPLTNIEVKFYLRLIFLNARHEDSVQSRCCEYEVRAVNKMGYNSVLDLLHANGIAKGVQKMRARTNKNM